MTARAGNRPETDVSRILNAVGPASHRKPETRPRESSALIVTVGLPGSGKSTFCRRLRDQIGAVILESDALRRLLFARPGYSAAESRRLFSALFGAAGELLRHGRDVIIDATNLKESDRTPVYRLAEEYGARLLLLRFEARRDVTERRLDLRSRAMTPKTARRPARAFTGRWRRRRRSYHERTCASIHPMPPMRKQHYVVWWRPASLCGRAGVRTGGIIEQKT